MAISVKQIIEEERRKANEPATAPVVTPEQNIQQDGSVPKGAIETRTAQYVDQLHKERMNAQQNAPKQPTEVIYDNKPDGWDDRQYEAVRSLGYTDEQISQAFSNPDPDTLMDGIYSSIYKKNVPEPRPEIDEKTMKRQKNIAGIGDVLSLLSQSISASMGARTRERAWEESATARLNTNQKELYEKYLAKSDRYNRDLVNAQMQDYLQGKQDWQQTKAGIQSAIQTLNKQRIEAAEKAQKDAIEREKLDISRQNAESMAQKREHDMKISEQNAQTLSAYRQSQINKNNAALKGKTSSLSGKKADVTFYLNTEEGDPNAQVDSFGRPIVEYNLSKDEIFSLAQEAKSDTEFMQRNSLILSQPDALGSGATKYAPDSEIALAYVQELYTQAQAGKSPYPQVTIPQPQWDEMNDVWQDPLDTPPYEQQKEKEEEEYLNQFLLDN